MGIKEVVQKATNEQLKDPLCLQVVSNYLYKLATGYFDQDIVDIVVQKSRSGYDLYDAAIFSSIWSAMCEGWIYGCPISVIDDPFSDNAVEENNHILSTIHPPFRAKFYGGPGMGDGNLWWDETITVGSFSPNDELGQPINEILEMDIKPIRSPHSEGGVVLEVGYTQSYTTFFHLAQKRFLARWPYGSKKIWLLVITNDKFWHP